VFDEFLLLFSQWMGKHAESTMSEKGVKNENYPTCVHCKYSRYRLM